MAKALLLVLISFSSPLWATEIKLSVKDPAGQPIQDAIVVAQPLAMNKTSPDPAARNASPLNVTTIAQIDKEFVPYVTVIAVGTAIHFPNHDDILHNVYSFSKAKNFQLPLYKDTAPEPVVFDQPGVVVLGCNIHDWMVAYVYVAETSFFAKTDENGQAIIAGLSEAQYQVRVWHPRKRKRGSTPAQTLDLKATNHSLLEFVITLKPEWRPQRGVHSQKMTLSTPCYHAAFGKSYES
ncbi:MAG: methylamine utilization protein [bacterium]|nr:methylamine utilization protein [bacterium]